MAEQAKAPEAAAPSSSAAGRSAAMADMINVADSLRLLQQQAAIEAMKLPDPPIDDAGPDGGAPPYTLRDDGGGKVTKINADGAEVDEQGKPVEAGSR